MAVCDVALTRQGHKLPKTTASICTTTVR